MKKCTIQNKIITVLLVFNFILLMTILHNKALGATYTYTNSSNNLPSDFDSKYPNYRKLVNTVVMQHPSWTVNLVETGLDWNTVLNNESTHGKNLVQPGYYTPDWGCSCNKVYDNPWKCASRSAVEYMMDPRNFINSYDIFQFQDLTAANGDESAVKTMIKGTFLDTDKNRNDAVKGIMEAASTYSINPYFITSKIIQEQSAEGSALSSGNGYDVNGDGTKEYVGYYNLFNIGAYVTSEGDQIANGLKTAYNNGWDSIYKSIINGARFIKNSYMAVGQTTIYFQKYNVINKNNLYYNQYMTNVWGAYSEGKIMRGKYINYGIYENKFTFLIPLYTGMPGMKGELARINADPSLKLKASGSLNGTYLLSVNQNVVVLVTERASNKVDGYYWDKVITPYGTGYMARIANDGAKYYLETLTLIEPNVINTNTNNNIAEPNEASNIFVEPNVTAGKLKEKYETATIKNKDGAEITGNTLVGTGAKIVINGEEKYTVIKLGDVNGDGSITPSDYVKIKNKIMGVSELNAVAEKAADVNKDGTISPADYVKIKNHIMNVSTITI